MTSNASRSLITAATVSVLALVLGACTGGGASGSGSPSASPPASSSSAAASPSSASPSPSTSAPSVTPTPQPHAAKKGEPPVITLSGFTVSDATPDIDVAAAMRKSINSSSSTRGLATGSSTHLYESDSGNGFMVMRISLSSRSRVLSDNQWNSFLKPGVAEFAGAKSAKVITVSGEKVVYAAGTTRGEPTIAYGWIHGRILTIIMAVGANVPSTQADETRRLVSGYVAAQS